MNQQCDRCKFDLSNVPIDLYGYKGSRSYYCKTCDRPNSLDKEYITSFIDKESGSTIVFMQDIEYEHTNTPWQIITADKVYEFKKIADPYYPNIHGVIRISNFKTKDKPINIKYFNADLSDIPKLIKKLNTITMLS